VHKKLHCGSCAKCVKNSNNEMIEKTKIDIIGVGNRDQIHNEFVPEYVMFEGIEYLDNSNL
jgi:methyl coenzyme M reductase subunit C-like uncharacterized protein (methanogenesis marker protein 7)